MSRVCCIHGGQYDTKHMTLRLVLEAGFAVSKFGTFDVNQPCSPPRNLVLKSPVVRNRVGTKVLFICLYIADSNPPSSPCYGYVLLIIPGILVGTYVACFCSPSSVTMWNFGDVIENNCAHLLGELSAREGVAVVGTVWKADLQNKQRKYAIRGERKRKHWRGQARWKRRS